MLILKAIVFHSLLVAQHIHCGTVFLATEESFAHAIYKQKIVSTRSTDTVCTEVFAINWPPRSPVRIIANTITEQFRYQWLGHGPDEFGRTMIASEAGRPVYKFSTDSPLQTTTGDLDTLPALAGQVAGSIHISLWQAHGSSLWSGRQKPPWNGYGIYRSVPRTSRDRVK